MRGIKYNKIENTSENFKIELNNGGKIISLLHPRDKYQMNWVRGTNTWGSIRTELDLSVDITRKFTEKGAFRETYTFTNDTKYDICAVGTMLGIYTTFPDYYTDSVICTTTCCNTHIWCGGASSYICALRMGGGDINLGLVLVEGSLKGYSVERDIKNSSNERGDFILHPDNIHLKPGQSYTISWELFWFEDKANFEEKISDYKDFITISSDHFVVLGDECIRFNLKVGTGSQESSIIGISDNFESIQVIRNNKKIPYIFEDGVFKIEEKPTEVGEYIYDIIWNGKTARARFLICSDIMTLAKKRLEYIADKQQCYDTNSYLDGAYLVYDTEENCQYYGYFPDHNAGRERVGMGVAMALYLQHYKDEKLEQSLDKFLTFVKRELMDEETGVVYNDAQRNADYRRPYNFPWISLLFIETFKLKKDKYYLELAYKVIKAYYKDDGAKFYAIGIPMYESIKLFRENGMEDKAGELLEHYEEHGMNIAITGKHYPSHEVKYEQSIVAPAAIYMCELYMITGDERYRKAALEQLEVLGLFQGSQPDYHLNEVAIRHWDGFWFGKKRLYGDTFPHYWSALSAIAYLRSKAVMKDDESDMKAVKKADYRDKIEKTFRGVLSMIHEDGGASCAYLYLMEVNGIEANYADPWANDQDWGLYFNLKYLWEDKEKH
uniref:hypothetical protein n=1 Tax=Clostridium sp. NkU-1 TaxID=1095009 RepID=UPI0006D25307